MKQWSLDARSEEQSAYSFWGSRGIRRPSLDARTMGKRQAALPATEREGRHYGARRVIDQDALEKVQCLCFITQYLRHFAVQVLNRGETALHEIH